MHRLFGLLAALALATSSSAAEPDRLSAIRQQGFIRVCADPANLPFSSSDTATPGFEVELAKRLADALGVEARFHWNPTYIRALRPLRRDKCDLFMGLPNDERFAEGLGWVAVSRPYYTMRHAIVTRADIGITSLDDLVGKRIAVDATSEADFYLLDKGIQRGIYKGQEKALQAVASGDAAAALIWMPVASWLTRDHPQLRVVPISEPRLDLPIGAGVRRRYRALAASVDQAMAQLIERHKVRDVLEQYGMLTQSPTQSAPEAQADGKQAPSVSEGKSVYSTVCSRCHGGGGVAGGKDGVPTIRNYAGGQDKFLNIVQNGKKNTPMAPFKNILTVAEILDVYHYLTSLPPP